MNANNTYSGLLTSSKSDQSMDFHKHEDMAVDESLTRVDYL